MTPLANPHALGHQRHVQLHHYHQSIKTPSIKLPVRSIAYDTNSSFNRRMGY